MEKRLTRTEMLFSLGFLFMLVCAVGAFFYGIKIGSDKTEAKLVQETKHLSGSQGPSVVSYQQQDLVSFYHTVFLPYREFQTEWTQTVHKITIGQLSDSASALKELASSAKSAYSEAENATVAATAPLLQQAQIQYLRALKTFGEAAERGADLAKNASGKSLAAALQKDAYYAEGVKQATTGQASYYYAMLKWGSSVDPDIPDHIDGAKALELANWKSLPLTVKNKWMADQMKARKLVVPFYPQDLTCRVDEFIASGEAGKMGIKTVGSIIDLLVSTDAVRAGDFGDGKLQLYGKELLPQLPFFFPEQG